MAYGRASQDFGESVFYRKSRRRRLIIAISSFLLLVIVVGAIIGIMRSDNSDSNNDNNTSTYPLASSSSSTPPVVNKAIKALCSVTLHQQSCYDSISAVEGANLTTDPEQLFRFSIGLAMDVLTKVSTLPANLSAQATDPRVKEALEICTEMIDDSLYQLNESLLLMAPKPGEKVLTQFKLDDVKTWLSATITDQETCLDGFENTTGGYKEKMQSALRNSTMFTSNSLAIADKILGFLDKFKIPVHRKLLSGLPEWVTEERRGLLQAAGAPAPDAVVAKDGSGQFTTISDALATVPLKSAKVFVIYVKAGKYVENVVVSKKMTNVVMVGDGVNRTVISGSKNFVDGTPTFKTATMVVEGNDFMAKGICIENTAGPEKHQAVALRVKADHTIFYQCSFLAFQDTLYTHSFRQYFGGCTVVGTVDFIFGDAAAVLQNCDILPRQPMRNQKNFITAQGKTDPSENTGLSIQRCSIRPYDAVTATTYLGRPWKPYSTTVFMTSDLGALVDPKGWRSWEGGSSSPPGTIFYGEYVNVGAGSSRAGRVTWSGYKPAMTDAQAKGFSVGSFIQGNDWLPGKGVEFSLTL